jgi:peptidoglycan pentaglycine glycine transferase (the first glycine)
MRVLQPGDSGFPSPAAWDEFVSACPRGHLLQSWAWGDLKGRFGWQPLRVALADGNGLLAVAQILLRRLPYRTLAYVPRGPVCDPDDDRAGQALVSALHQVARGHQAIALKAEPNWPDSPEAEGWWTRHGFAPSWRTIQPRRTIVVDLRPGEEEILAQMKPKWRYNVRLASRREVSVRRGSVEDLPVFYRLMQETSRRDGFGIHTLGYYETAYLLFEPGEHVALLLAEYQGRPIAGLMAFAFAGMGIYMYGASSNEERQRMPNHLLQWEAMRWARARGCTGYDLWGIADVDPDSPSTVLAGVERFKAGFGGKERRFAGAFDHAYSPLVYSGFNWLWRRRSARIRRARPAESEG